MNSSYRLRRNLRFYIWRMWIVSNLMCTVFITMMQPPFLWFVTIFYTFAVQEKVDSLNEKVERESFIGDKQSCDLTDFDNSSSKSLSKPKCEYWLNDTFYSYNKFVSISSQNSESHTVTIRNWKMYKKRRNGRLAPLYFEDPKFQYMPMNQLSGGSGSFPQSRETCYESTLFIHDSFRHTAFQFTVHHSSLYSLK